MKPHHKESPPKVKDKINAQGISFLQMLIIKGEINLPNIKPAVNHTTKNKKKLKLFDFFTLSTTN